MEAQPAKREKKQKKQPKRWRWCVTIVLVTVCISAAFSFISSVLLENSGMLAAFLLLFFIVALGILFDMVGVAVTAADEKPFHAMAAKKVPGAGKAIWLLRNADKVASFCNDVVGDICGIISGAASAVIAGQIIAEIAQTGRGNVVQLAMSGLVAGMTVGGKAAGKSIAMRCSTNIVFLTARVLGLFSRKNK